ncbi:MAG: putative S-layer protein [Nanoarchaeota archaeon]|nr:putative S-layer protein [Nanoarchaeota archaeon]
MVKNASAVIGILAVLVFSLAMVSATSLQDITEYTIPANVNHNVGSFDIIFNLKNTGTNGTLDFSSSTISLGTAVINIDFNDFYIENGTATPVIETIKATVTFEKYQLGNIEGIISVIGEGMDVGNYKTLPFTITINSSSELTISLESPLTKTQNGTIKVMNIGNTNLTGIKLVETTTADFDVQFNESIFNLNPGQFILIEVSSTNIDDLDFNDDCSMNIKATDGTTHSNEVITLSTSSEFYSGKNEGELEVSFDDINTLEGFGDDEAYWYPLDEVELEIKVDNKGDWDIKDIEIGFCLLDESKNRCILDESDVEIDEEDFDLDFGDDKTIRISFIVHPRDLRKDSDYVLYVSAIGKIDDSSSPYDDEKTGDSSSKEIEIRTDEEFVVIEDIEFTSSDFSLVDGEFPKGGKVEMTATVWNIGDKDIKNDEIFVLVYNGELGIKEVIEFNKDLDSLDSQKITYSFEIPSDAESKTYAIELSAYDDKGIADKDIYENSEDDEAIFNGFLKVTEGIEVIPKPTISASLESEAKVGEEMVIVATIINNGKDGSYDISVSGYESWAELVSVSPQSLSLDEDEEGTVTITFIPNKPGVQTFKVNAESDGESYDQAVSVNITEKKGLFEDISKTVLYSAAGIALLVVLILLTLIVKVSRRSRKVPQF